jgi:hypothetical protein
MATSPQFTARAEGGTHDGEEFDISEETVGLLLKSRSNPVTLEYYELVLYFRGNLLRFVRELRPRRGTPCIRRHGAICSGQTYRTPVALRPMRSPNGLL